MNDLKREIPQPVLERAAQWFVRLQQEPGHDRTFSEWQQWLSAAREHRIAFEQIEDTALSVRAAPHSALRLPDSREMDADGYDGSRSVDEWKDARALLQHRSTARRRIAYALAASVTLLAAGGVAWVFTQSSDSPQAPRTYSTQHGMKQTWDLPDGSTITLDADSGVETTYTRGIRLLRLVRGEAYFEVAPDARRRFTVDTGMTRVVALGTAFNVRLSGNRTIVAVTDGKVVVTAAAQTGAGQRERGGTMQLVAQVSAGEAVAYSDNGNLHALPATEASLATGWMQGHRQYRNEPLRYVLADITRYTGQSIQIADERAGELKFTGTLNLRNSAAWLQGLSVALPVRILQRDGGHLAVALEPMQ